MNSSAIVLDQQLDSLDRLGYIEMNAKSEYFADIVRRLRFAHPDLLTVEKVGEYSIGQIAFLPRVRDEIRTRLLRELARWQDASHNTAKALAAL